MKSKPSSKSTTAVRAGEERFWEPPSFQVPIFQTAIFSFSSVAQLRDYAEGKKKGYLYTRYENPTIEVVQKKMAALEGGEACVAFASGMAAITTSILAFLQSGEEIVSTQGLYGGTFNFFKNVLPRFGIRVHFVPSTQVEMAARKINRRTRALYIETPTNPALELVDIEAAVALSRKHGLLTFIDNTFASPINQQPLAMGCDISLHSGTKYLGGHSDLLSGFAVAQASNVAKIQKMSRVLGGCMDPHAAFMANRGMKTLALRVEKQNANALAVAEFLSRHPRVESVNYPGLSSHRQHALACRQMSGFGGIVCFQVQGKLKQACRVLDRLKMIPIAASLGGVETLAITPLYTSHFGLTHKELAAASIYENTLRLSLGIEDVEDIVEDLDQALRSI